MSDLETEREERGEVSPSGDSEPRTRGAVARRIRLLVLQAAALMGAFLFFTALVTAGAGWYTSRSEFCRSCHIMEPYYQSWKESSHGDVSCIKCHFPPGAGEKIRGKMLGLVQLAKYVTGTAGSRPAAEISDASCLRTGCHEDRMLAGTVDYFGVPFDHKPHLEDLRRGKSLRCTSCHSQIVQGSHMTVTPSTCFLCHFKGEPFNAGLAACTRCHQIPQEDFDLGGGVTYNHDLAYERGVECINCHDDLIRGDGVVPPERCGVCHNRLHDLERRGDTEFMHKTHVTDHKVDCLDCHLQIEHAKDPHRVEHAAADCTSCHPDHHQQQVSLLQGVGGKSVASQSNAMTEARVACPACHKRKTTSGNGSELWTASVMMCVECHEDKTIDEIQAQNELLQSALLALKSDIERARTALAASDLSAQRREAVAQQIEVISDDLAFLTAANGIHNIHYAESLTAALFEKLIAVCRELSIYTPNIALPSEAE